MLHINKCWKKLSIKYEIIQFHLGYSHVCATYLNVNILRALGHITLCPKSFVQRQTPLHSPPKPHIQILEFTYCNNKFPMEATTLKLNKYANTTNPNCSLS